MLWVGPPPSQQYLANWQLRSFVFVDQWVPFNSNALKHFRCSQELDSTPTRSINPILEKRPEGSFHEGTSDAHSYEAFCQPSRPSLLLAKFRKHVLHRRLLCLVIYWTDPITHLPLECLVKIEVPMIDPILVFTGEPIQSAKLAQKDCTTTSSRIDSSNPRTNRHIASH